MENTIMTLKSYNENDVYEIAVYDYRLLCNSDEYCNHEEIQRFYTPSQYNDLQFLEVISQNCSLQRAFDFASNKIHPAIIKT